MQWQIEPMASWPYRDTAGSRKTNPFRAKFDDTLRLLEDELEHLGVVDAVAVRVVAREADVRRDGMLRAKAQVLHPGVALSFRSSTAGDLTYPCDQYAGWRAIEASPSKPRFGSADEARQWLRLFVDTEPGVNDASLLRLAAREAHPDRRGGDRAAWDTYDLARQLLEGGAR